MKNTGFCGKHVSVNKSAFPDGQLCAEPYECIQGSYGDSDPLLTKKYPGIKKEFS